MLRKKKSRRGEYEFAGVLTMFDRMVNEGLTERAILESGNEGIE